MFEMQKTDILENMQNYHDSFYRAHANNLFVGPSLYFHERALATNDMPLTSQHIEYLYATLVSWGMHRMGNGGPKMKDFYCFKESIYALEGIIALAQQLSLLKVQEDDWLIIKEIFDNIDVMSTNIKIIGNSKVMHHMLPKLVPPIDREYTMNYLYHNRNIRNNIQAEWNKFREVLIEFFIPILSNHQFIEISQHWIETDEVFLWDTSLLKIIDNLIIGAMQ